MDGLGAPARTDAGGIEQLRWRRSFHGIPAFADELRVNLGPDGAVLTASGASADAAPPTLTPALSPVQAMAVVMDDAGAAGAPRVASGPTGPRRDTTFAGGGRARLVVFGSRLAWDVYFLPYETMVDAGNGAILYRANLVKSDAPVGNVWDDFPAGDPRQNVPLDLPAGSTTLANQFIHAFSDADGDDTPQASEEVTPGAYTLAKITSGGGCSAAKPCTWSPAANDWTQNRDAEAVEAFYLASVYRQHLAAPPFDFAFGTGADQLYVETDWNAQLGEYNNSGMATPAPGLGFHPLMELNLFGGDGFRATAGGLDASIVFHEYTHGFTNRTVVYSDDGSQALNTAQAWAIDEASADFFAKSYLVDRGLEADSAAPGEVDMGNYTDVTPHSIRKEALDCPVGASTAACPDGGLTYADFGHVDAGGPEPHYDGEIWSETMWDLRTRLGSDKATQLATDALRLVPPEPSFLDMRDAILTADAARGYDDAPAIWQVFATRGMGCDASTNGSDDASPHAGFDAPPCPAPTPIPTATATATPLPTVSPTPEPTVSPSPVPAPPARPSFSLKRSGRRGAAFTVTCRAACSVTGTLRVSRPVARKLHLGSRRVVGRLSAKLKAAGRRTYTVRLTTTARRAMTRRKVKSFRATLTAQAVYPGAVVASKHRTVSVRR